jgi:hypothetical protein
MRGQQISINFSYTFKCNLCQALILACLKKTHKTIQLGFVDKYLVVLLLITQTKTIKKHTHTHESTKVNL